MKTKKLSGTKRTLFSAGLLLGILALSTSAVMTDMEQTLVQLDGTNNRFNMVVAGSTVPGWEPTDADWSEGNPEAYSIRLSDDGGPYAIAPGEKVHVRLAVKNDSPKLAGALTLELRDPYPRQGEIDAATGRYVELFDKLLYTVKDGETVLFDRAQAKDLHPISWDPGDFRAQEVRMLDVTIELPYETDNRWQKASTDVQFYFEAENL